MSQHCSEKSVPMPSWQYFVNTETGIGYKSTSAVQHSVYSLEDLLPNPEECDLTAMTKIALRIQSEHRGKLQWRMPCDRHGEVCKREARPQIVKRNMNTEETSSHCMDVILVNLERSLLVAAEEGPKGSTTNDDWQDCLDVQYQREADAELLEKLRRSVSAKRGRETVFFYFYGERSTCEAISVLKQIRGDVLAVVTPRFKSIAEFFTYVAESLDSLQWKSVNVLCGTVKED